MIMYIFNISIAGTQLACGEDGRIRSELHTQDRINSVCLLSIGDPCIPELRQHTRHLCGTMAQKRKLAPTKAHRV